MRARRQRPTGTISTVICARSIAWVAGESWSRRHRRWKNGAQRWTGCSARRAAVSNVDDDPFSRRSIEWLVGQYGSPLLILDAERVRRQYRRLGKALPGV